LRFTVHRPPDGEVSLCWYRPSGGDVAGCVHVGVAWPGFAGDACEDRLALAAFARDVPTCRASLRRIRSCDPFEPARGLVVEPGNQPTPTLMTDGAVEPPFLRSPSAREFHCAARGAGHRPHVEVLHANGVESARQIGRGLFDPIASPVGFTPLELRNRQFDARSAVGATLGARQALQQAAQPGPLARSQARSVQQLPGRQGCRHHHTEIDTDHAAIVGPLDRTRDVCKRDMPAAGPIRRDAIRPNTRWNASRPAEANPPDLGHPHPPITAAELFDMAWFETDLPEALVDAGLTKRRAPMGAREKAPHGLAEVAQRLLLDRLRPGRQPVVFRAGLGQLGRLVAVPRGPASWLPQPLLFHGQIPHKPGMPAMLHQNHLLRWCGQQPEPIHTRKVATTTDKGRQCTSAYVEIGELRRHQCRGFPPKEV
jgi:hypothetical protein